MAEEFVRLVKIGIDKSFIQESIANADRLAKSIDELKKVKKEEGQLSAEQEGRLKALTAERNKNIQVVKQANLLTSEQIKGQEQLKAQLSILTAQYNKLTTEEQKNTKEGQALQKQVLKITEELKANEKAVGDNRRNVGNYAEAWADAAKNLNIGGVNLGSLHEQLESFKTAQSESTTGAGKFTGSLQGLIGGIKQATIASLKFLATPIGAALAAIAVTIGLMVGGFKLLQASLNRTEDGSAKLAAVMNTFKGIMSGVLKVIEPIALFLVDGLASGIELLGETVEKASAAIQKGLEFLGLEAAAKGLNNITTAIKETSIATAQLAKAEAELNKIQREQGKIQLEYQKRAEKLRQIRDDESLSMKERIQANKDLGAVLTEQSNMELMLAKRALEIAELRIKADGASTENLDKKAEAELKILEIEERITGQRSEQLTNENSLIREGVAIQKAAAAERVKQTEEEKKAAEEAAKALEESFKRKRDLIDEQTELDQARATIEIENAEKRAERIAFLEREALVAKIASINEEVTEETAAADAISAIDEEKYAKQLAERAKYEAELAEMDRAAKAEAFTRQVELLNGQEQLDIEAAEFEIQNETELQNRKYQIALEYAQKRMELMREEAMLDGVLTEQEKQNLQSVENEIKRIQEELANPDAPTTAQSLGLSQEDIEKMQLGLSVVSQALQSVQQATQAAAQNRIAEIDQQSKAEIDAINKSTLSEEQKEKKITEAEQKAAKERYKVELAQFKTAKALQIALAVANTATAVMAQLSNPTPYAGFVLAALAAATGAVQIGIVASQKPPPPPAFATGGYVKGAGSGTSDSITAKLSNGESVNTAKATAMFGPILSAMNKAGGGVDWYRGEGYAKGGIVQKFAAGGVVSSSSAIMRENEAVANLNQTILQSPPVLVLEEFQNVQGRQVRTEQNLQV